MLSLNFTTNKLSKLTRLELIKELQDLESVDLESIKAKLEWLKQQIDFNSIDKIIFYSEPIKKSIFSSRQYTCFQYAVYGILHRDLRGAYHEFCDFISNHRSPLEINVMEAILIKMWIDLFDREYHA